MSFARTFLQTSRALSARNSINPVQHALGNKGRAQFLGAARSYATAFERSKPHVNIGTIGHVDHGKVRPSIKWQAVDEEADLIMGSTGVNGQTEWSR